MKSLLLSLIILLHVATFAQSAKTENVILVTFDGYRWQEMFGGAQQRLYTDKTYGKELDKLTFDYKGGDAETRRAKLTPFIWSTIAKQGTILGNKKKGNRVTVTNMYKFSFPGYNEIFSGWGDRRINSNKYGDNPNTTIFDFLKAQKDFDGKLFAVATWDAFTKIINVHRNNIPLLVDQKPNSTGGVTNAIFNVDKWETTIPQHGPFAKTDTFTYRIAKEYLKRNHPRFAFIGFDETDDYAHGGNYAAYLATAHTLDSYMQDLWNFIQSDPQYKDKTTLIITCDHGRGNMPKYQWRHHSLAPTAKNIWIAAIGAGIKPNGEVTKHLHVHQNQIAATIAQLLGFKYDPGHYAGKPIDFLLK